MVTHTGIEKPAAEATAACGGNRKPKQAQRSQKASPAQGAQADAVTASRNPASASRGAKTALRAVFRVREIPCAVRQFAKRKHTANRRRHIEQTGRGASGAPPLQGENRK